MARTRLRWTAVSDPLCRLVPGLYVGTPRRNTLVTLGYLVVLLTVLSALL
ncbi:hypothetical protein SAMN04487948_103145 [Halogranum amylolyticum]|uniref:Uncharacterized protein n=1 Tax=Halogranum amylolyticum TaxID=660520 RepID=A0A1H8QIU4_9EURY|nr:hypothetical protein [Halogranum amylolyticum]SEO54122.1 hypothetical protein SAMN04487948_103145 [Halogranum amylolyticum]